MYETPKRTDCLNLHYYFTTFSIFETYFGFNPISFIKYIISIVSNLKRLIRVIFFVINIKDKVYDFGIRYLTLK